jgi:DNA gyrase subunit B
MKKEIKIEKQGSYEAKDIYVLKGLEAVRRRPGMYIGTTGSDGLHHLIYEVTDNALDEFMMGYGNEMKIVLLPNNRVMVSDNGRGIPVDIHPQTKKSALETVMTTLHAGAKFGGKSYQVSGGLHGVGVSVVCALSSWMRAEVCRDGIRYAQEYVKGRVKTAVKKSGTCKQSGTTIIFEPDQEIFKGFGKTLDFEFKKILNHLRQQAYLTKGIKIIVSDTRALARGEDKRSSSPTRAIAKGEDERSSSPEQIASAKKNYNFYFEGGLASYLKYLTNGIASEQENLFYGSGEKNGILVEIALLYTQEYECYEESFANNIWTREGGTHLTGFRTALTRILNDYARKNNFIKEGKENSLTGDDIREGLTGVVSIKIKEPQFEGQTKAKLGNPEAKSAVEQVMTETFTDFLERNPKDAKTIIEKCILSFKARKAARAAKEVVLRKGVLDGLALPGKLADCTSKQPEESELYIVEGESAGGSGRQARNRHFQAILPLRGKILNVERSRLDKILNSKEIRSLIIALGTAIAEDFNLNKLRYHRIIIMSDGDVDGAHIRTLLLTLFYRYFRPLIESGYLYIAQPPLYKMQGGKEIKYAHTEEQKKEMLKYFGNRSVFIQRYKGLGEMNADELWETTMNPENRVLLKVDIEDIREADKIFDILMGDEVSPRKKFIQVHAKKVKNLDI